MTTISICKEYDIKLILNKFEYFLRRFHGLTYVEYKKLTYWTRWRYKKSYKKWISSNDYIIEDFILNLRLSTDNDDIKFNRVYIAGITDVFDMKYCDV